MTALAGCTNASSGGDDSVTELEFGESYDKPGGPTITLSGYEHATEYEYDGFLGQSGTHSGEFVFVEIDVSGERPPANEFTLISDDQTYSPMRRTEYHRDDRYDESEESGNVLAFEAPEGDVTVRYEYEPDEDGSAHRVLWSDE